MQHIEAWRCHVEKEKQSFLRWMVCCVVVAVLVALLAVAAKSFLFAVIAMFFCFFAWNRWQEWKRADRLLSIPLPQTDEQAVRLSQRLGYEMSKPPTWERVSNWIAAVTAVVCVASVSIGVVATSGFWMRALYAVVYAPLVLMLIWLVRIRRRESRAEEEARRRGRDIWQELT